ncbi:MAG: hypothetical protein RMM58_05930 [Chloroflexota bacterium]|nr:hypothetical protein [Dehalococcoidia bacterium]MDW8253400.1 hypothetical protein [Chloroflexota bacterium]
MLASPGPEGEIHDHLCLYCGRWSRAGEENGACPRCHRDSPPIHSAHQLLGAWGLNVFLEERGVTETVAEPAWAVRVLPGAVREEVALEISWTALDPPRVRRLLDRWCAAIGLDPRPRFRRRVEGQEVYVAAELYSLEQFTHPAGLYRLLASRLALTVGALLSLGDSLASGAARPKPPRVLSWVGEWLVRFLSAPPLLDPRRLVDRFCVRCFHDEVGFFEPTCTYFRDNPEIAWGAGGEPWYDLMVALGDQLADEEVRASFLAGPDGAMPPVPLDGPADGFALIGRVLSHFRPRRCPGFVPTGRMLTLLDDWATGKASLTEVALGAYDPLLVRAAGDRLELWIADLFEGKVQPFERKERRPGETAFVATRLLNLAEWLSAGALENPQRAP